MNHSFDVAVAAVVGVNAAVIFQTIAFWCQHSEANEKNYHDGAYWTFSSNKAFRDVFPYMTASQIDTALRKLLDADMIRKGNYNKSAYDRTMWYALTENGKSISEKSNMEKRKTKNRNAENREPIPNTINNPINDKSNVRFTPPTFEDVRLYAREKGYTPKEFDPQEFIDFYTQKGWKVGKDGMKDWKASVRLWVTRYRKEHPEAVPKQTDRAKMGFTELMNSMTPAEWNAYCEEHLMDGIR